MFFKIDVLKNFASLTGKHQCRGLFFKEVARLRPETLLNKRLQHRWFPVSFPFFTEHLRWLLLVLLNTQINPFKVKYSHHKKTSQRFSSAFHFRNQSDDLKFPSLSTAFFSPTPWLMVFQNLFVLLCIWSLVFLYCRTYYAPIYLHMIHE